MTFAIETMTKAKITDVVVLSQKNREPGANPGAALSFALELSNNELAHFDGSLKSFLYTKSAASSSGQQGLDGVESVSDMPNLTKAGIKVGKFHWNEDLYGYALVIDHGIGGKSNLDISDCIVSKFKIEPKEGGTILVDFLIESQDVPEKTFGKLATLKNLEVKIALTAPEVKQESLAGGAQD
jgi:hypothetical protein